MTLVLAVAKFAAAQLAAGIMLIGLSSFRTKYFLQERLGILLDYFSEMDMKKLIA